MPVRIDPRSFRTDFSISVLAAIFIALTGRLIADVAIRIGAPEYWAHWSDDIFTGVVAGAVLFAALRNNSAKRRLIQQRLQEVLETNHNIRNALQVIGSSHLAASEAERLKMVSESVARIDRTLREFSAVDSAQKNAAFSQWRARVETAENVKSKNLASSLTPFDDGCYSRRVSDGSSHP